MNPRIWKTRFGWMCGVAYLRGFGDTPGQAYSSWIRIKRRYA